MIGYIQGRYDIIYYGHILTLINAKRYINNGLLIVGVASDVFCETWKKKKPVLNWYERSSVLRHIDFIDVVISYDEVYPDAIYNQLKFDIFFCSSELYNTDIQFELDKKPYKTIYLPRTPNISSTIIKNNVL